MNRKRNTAFASVIVVLLMFVVLTLCLGLAAWSSQAMVRSQKETDDVVAFQACQAALEYQTATSYANAKKVGYYVSEENNLNDFVTTLTPGATASAKVQPTSDNRVAWITATATYNGRTYSLREYLNSKDVSIWNNAIFAGNGAAGKSINGNVDVRGSVHILGDGEPYSDLNGNGKWDAAESFTDKNKNGVWDPGEPFVDANGDGIWNAAEPFNDVDGNGIYDAPNTATDMSDNMSGSAKIGNNYSGMPADLEAMVPAPPTVNGLESLSTEVRVKHGLVNLSGTATIGESSNPDGGTSKGKVDGVYVNDGWGGNKGASNVYSDNGTANAYDLGSLGITFPYIKGIGAETYVDGNGTNWTTHSQYYDNKCLTVPVNSINASTAAFDYSDSNGNRFKYTPAVKSGNTVVTPATLEVKGIVKISGDLAINGQSELRYLGRGTMYVTNDVYIGNNLLPQSGKKFPTDTALGLVAGRNMGLATGNGDSQLKMAGAFYAQGTVSSAKQNQIVGSFVCSFFDMGGQVPNIYQVPSLRTNMPPAMPGDNPIVSLNIRTWRVRH
ncbi:MAG: hypothetical protein JSS65_02095 [Armatimonadetes bacterium]|nr:hypothetical protein [Armatimonadota bacterium]